MGSTYKCFLGSNVVFVTVFEIFRVKILTVDLLILVGLTAGPKVTKGEMTYYPLCLPSYKISARSRKRSTRYALPIFFTFCRWLSSQVCRTGLKTVESVIDFSIFYLRGLPWFKGRRYQIPAYKERKKTSTPFNPSGVNPHMPIAGNANSL